MGEVVNFPGDFIVDFDNPEIEDLGVNVDMVLEGAIDAHLKEIIILGRDEEGRFFFASSTGNLPKVYLELAKAQKFILDATDISYS